MPEGINFFSNFVNAMTAVQDRKRQYALDIARNTFEAAQLKLQSDRLQSDISNREAVLDVKRLQVEEAERSHQANEQMRHDYEVERVEHDRQMEGLRGQLNSINDARQKAQEQHWKDQDALIVADVQKAKKQAELYQAQTSRTKAEASNWQIRNKYADAIQRYTMNKDRREVDKIDAEIRRINADVGEKASLITLHRAEANLANARAANLPTDKRQSEWEKLTKGAEVALNAVNRSQDEQDKLIANREELQQAIIDAESSNTHERAPNGEPVPHDQLMIAPTRGHAKMPVQQAEVVVQTLQKQIEQKVQDTAKLQNYYNTWQGAVNKYAPDFTQTPTGGKPKPSGEHHPQPDRGDSSHRRRPGASRSSAGPTITPLPTFAQPAGTTRNRALGRGTRGGSNSRGNLSPQAQSILHDYGLDR